MLIYEKENFLGKQEFNYFNHAVINSPWQYRNDSVKGEPEGTCFGFYHVIYNQGVKSNLFDMTSMLIHKLCDESNLTLRELRRMRANMFTRYPHRVNHDIHVDYIDNHYTALFYLNTNNGPTTLYDRFKEPNAPFEDASTLQLGSSQEIMPVENKIVLFDGLRYHGSSTHTDSNYRIVMNLNFVADKK